MNILNIKTKFVATTIITLAFSSTMVIADTAMSLTNDTDKLSYSIGADLGKNFKRQGITVNPEARSEEHTSELQSQR